MPQRRLAPRLKIFISTSISTIVLVAVLFVTRSLWRANRLLVETSRQTASSKGLPFSFEQLRERSKGRFDASLHTAEFRSVAPFAGDLFVCGRASLLQYGTDGKLKQGWYVGEQLPPYPLQSLAVRRGIGTPELWIATAGAGVLVYDGRVFKQLIPAGLAQRKINVLLPLDDGRVVIGTDNAGLVVTDGKHLDFVHPLFAHTDVTALAGNEDELWIGTRNEGAWLWRAGAATHFLTELADRQVLSLAESEGTVWVGTPLGVAEFSRGQFRRRLAEGTFAQSLVARAGVLSIGTMDEGLVNVNLRARLARLSFGLQQTGEGQASVVALASVGGEVLAVEPSAVRRFSHGEAAVVSNPQNSLADGHISALSLDGRGRLWIGYFDHGIDVADLRSGRIEKHVENDVLFCVNRIKEDPADGTVAVAAANGLTFFDSAAQLRRTLDAKNGLPFRNVTDLLYRKRGSDGSSLAVATPSGVSFVEDGSTSSVTAFQGLVNNHVYTLTERDGMLFAGTLGGFSTLQNGTVEASYTTANSAMHQNWITASATAGEDVYLGTYGGGVVRIDRHANILSFQDFSKERIEINPNALLSTDTAIYAGTAGQGLVVLRQGEERWRFIRDGLPSLNVTALAAGNGTLYVGTDNGLVSVPEQRLLP